MGTSQVTSQQVASQQVVSQQVGSQVTSQQVASQQVASQQVTSQKVTSQQATGSVTCPGLQEGNIKDSNKCKYCDKCFKTTKELKNHEIDDHEPYLVDTVSCDECKKTFGS